MADLHLVDSTLTPNCGGRVLMLRTCFSLISQEWTPWPVASATLPS
uniref:Pco103489b n=1 Tax=Arundo donax TaxID=35708 RepID=A0A0A9EP67_ARUDO